MIVGGWSVTYPSAAWALSMGSQTKSLAVPETDISQSGTDISQSKTDISQSVHPITPPCEMRRKCTMCIYLQGGGVGIQL